MPGRTTPVCMFSGVTTVSGGFPHSTAITVLDPVLISNITSNSNRLGQDIAVSVQFSGEEAAVTWEADGGSLPHRYRLTDDNRTLIILSAQREDGGRRLHIRITNPVSEETREYLLEITGPLSLTLRLSLVAALAVVILLSAGIFLCCRRKNMAASKDGEMKPMDGHSEANGRPPRADQSVVLLIQILSSVSSVYVRRGSDITDCGMECTDKESILDLYRECGAGDTKLLELWCDNMWSDIHFDSRLHLNTSSGCWRLTDARKGDSCEYVLWRHNRSRGFWNSTAITVLDPVLISSITSNSSRLGQDIAVNIQFSGEEAAVTWEVDGGSLPDRYWLMDDNRTLIIPSAQREDAERTLRVRITNPVSEESQEYLLGITDALSSPLLLAVAVAGVFLVLMIIIIILLVKCRKTTRHVERNNHSEEHGGQSSSSSENDPSGEQEEETKEKNPINIIHSIWKKVWKNSEYEGTRRDERAENDDISITLTE
ncbi:uncharacterized protein [Eleutherodactylus coqui]|uniref:uncharacterized protein isoform X2 n=1 Tax=Eleutherodactylus coqui TaxID=57060 RepID=UPI00346368D1